MGPQRRFAPRPREFSRRPCLSLVLILNMFVKDDGKIVLLILYRCLLRAASLIPLKRRRSLQYSTNNNYVNR
jgi:hypothetical protein